MTLHSQSLAPDWKTPLILVRGIAQDLGIRLRDAGAVVTPDSGTVALYRNTDATDTYLSPTALAPGSTSTYALPAISSTEPLSELWTASWSVVSGGNTYGYRQRVFLVGTALTPRISDEDLYPDEPDLRHPARRPAGQSSWQTQIDEAWIAVLKCLTDRGKRPWLAVDDVDLRQWHLYESLARCCGTILAEAGSHYPDAAVRYRKQAADAANDCRIEYEDDPGVHKAVGPTVIPCAPRGRPLW